VWLRPKARDNILQRRYTGTEGVTTRYDAATDEVLLLGSERKTAESLAADLAGGTGYVIQRRLDGDAQLVWLFGPRLWSVRALVLAGPSSPVIHRAVAKIATGSNAANNFWRHGNMLGAIELETGIISRVERGTGAEMSVNETHPDTKRPIVGTLIPQWEALTRLVISTAEILPGIRTQSWDIALAAYDCGCGRNKRIALGDDSSPGQQQQSRRQAVADLHNAGRGAPALPRQGAAESYGRARPRPFRRTGNRRGRRTGG
jgi:hypothetical protein